MEEIIKPKKSKKILFIILISIILVIIGFFAVTATLYMYGNTSSGTNIINNPLSSNAHRHAVTNLSNNEVMYYDNQGNIQSLGNLTFNDSTNGYGYFNYLGSIVSRVTKGWFVNLDATNINSTITNSTIYYENGNRLALNSSLNMSWNEAYANGKYVKNNSGIAGYIPQFQSAGVINNSVIYQNGTNIGIGTNSPQSTLTVAASVATNASLLALSEIGNNGINKISMDWFFGNNLFNGGRIDVQRQGVTSGFDMGFYTKINSGELSERMRITSTGLVGIGTSTPSNTLDVRGVGNFSGTVYINNGTDVSTLGNASWNESYANTKYANISWNYNQTTATYNLYNNIWSSTFNATYAGYATNVSKNWTLDAYNNWNTVWLSTYNATYDANIANNSWNESYANTKYYSITNPNNYVNVTSISNTTIVRASSFNCTSGFIQNVTINSSGIFGLCASTMSYTNIAMTNISNFFDKNQTIRNVDNIASNIGGGNLEIYSGDMAGINKGGSLGFGGFVNSTALGIFGQISGRKEDSTNSNNGYLSFSTSSLGVMKEKMRISSSGNVGIGRTPSQKLDVNGSVYIGDDIAGSDDYEYVTISNGNINMSGLIQLNITTFPSCDSTTNGNIGRNATNVYMCNSTCWIGWGKITC